MGTNVNEITSAEWSLSLKQQGDVEQGFNDINQCINIIVSTQKGTDPLRPQFGCDMWRFLDAPLNDAAPNMVREILDALATWEERIEVTDVLYTLQSEAVSFNIKWILLDNRQKGAASITLSFAPTRQPETPPVIVAPIDAPILSAVYTYPNTELSWVFDAPTGVTFQILRSINGGVFVELAEVIADTSYTDADPPKDSELTYIVRAVKGSRVSDFSNEATVNSIEAILSFATSDDSYISLSGVTELIETIGGITKVYLPTNTPDQVTTFFADDAGDPNLNAGILGALNLDDRFTALRTVRARNQSFGFVAGTWVRNANVDIDVENSIISANRVRSIIDEVILANGGTTNDDGSNYTGVPGETHANRTLNIGTITIDLSDPENSILLQKVIALQGVGWTITTVRTLCDKFINLSSGDFNFVNTTLEESTQITSTEVIEGEDMELSLFPTLQDAINETNVLAVGRVAINAYLSTYIWAVDELLGLRAQALNPADTSNTLQVKYKAFPTDARACGEVVDVIGLSAIAAYSSRKILQASYTGDRYLTDNGANVDGNLIRLYDQSGNGYDLIKEDPSFNDLVVFSDVISNPAKGQDAYLNAVQIGDNLNNLSIFVRYDIRTLGSQGTGIYGIQRDSADDRIVLATPNAAQNRGRIVGINPQGIQFDEGFALNGGFAVVGFVKDSDNYAIFVDGVKITTFTNSDFTSLLVNENRIYASGAVNVNRPLIESTDFITYDKALTDFEAAQVSNFLAL